MNIGIVIESYFPEAGGNERSTDQIARQLIARGHHVTILANQAHKDPNFLPGGRIETAALPATTSALGLLLFRRWAIRQLQHNPFDATLSMTTAVPAQVLQPRGGTYRETLARNIAMRPPGLSQLKKRITTALNAKRMALLWAERRTLKSQSVHRVASISKYVSDQLFYGYSLPAHRVALIPNASSAAPIDPAQRDQTRCDVRRRLDLSDDHVVFLFAAMNPSLKGLGPLVRALVHVRTHCPGARLIVAGTLQFHFQHRAEQLGVRDMIRWVGPTSSMADLFAAADATVHPTYYDPSSKIVIESLLHHVPAISTLFNGASQWIEDPTGQTSIGSRFSSQLDSRRHAESPNRAGRVINTPDNIDDLAQAMIDLCDPDQRARCTQATHQLDPALTMDRHVDLLETLLHDAR
ncbi:MAG: hypothetical protein CMJ49_08825 [Planctomycetaceae bacterium]|nr:hypothetical protein [Planctomycetaceae bacterium]